LITSGSGSFGSSSGSPSESYLRLMSSMVPENSEGHFDSDHSILSFRYLIRRVWRVPLSHVRSPESCERPSS
jgi:hypothetical protein